MLSGSELIDVESDQYTIAIQPIVNVQLQHVADELLYRGNAFACEALAEQRGLEQKKPLSSGCFRACRSFWGLNWRPCCRSCP